MLNLQYQEYNLVMTYHPNRDKLYTEKILEKKARIKKSLDFCQDILDGNREDLGFNSNGDEIFIMENMVDRIIIKAVLSDILRNNMPIDDYFKKIGISHISFYNVLSGRQENFSLRDKYRYIIHLFNRS
jgi:hypothetical protein